MGWTDAAPVVMSNWAFQQIDGTLVLCTAGQGAPPEQDFKVWLARLAMDDYSGILIHALGGQPSPTQRRRIAAHWRSARTKAGKIAVLTDSLASRAVLTMMEWFISSWTLKGFSLQALPEAVRWLELTISAEALQRGVSAMHAALREHELRVAPGPRTTPNSPR